MNFYLYFERWDENEENIIETKERMAFETLEACQEYASSSYNIVDGWWNPTKDYIWVAPVNSDGWALTIVDEFKSLLDYHNNPGPGWTWYSVCSGHSPRADGTYHEIDTECNRCMAGCWVNDKKHEEDVKLHDEDYDAWYKKHNAPDSDSRRFLKTIFPNLK